jgi:hypothetical protein
MAVGSSGLGRTRNPHGTRNRTWDRQHHFFIDHCGTPAPRTTPAWKDLGIRGRSDHENPVAVVLVLGYAADHPTIFDVGVALITEGFGFHIPKGYLYFSMAFSVVVEMLNIRMRKKTAGPVKLHKHLTE